MGVSVPDRGGCVEALAALAAFRRGLYACFARRSDGLFELNSAMLSAGPSMVSGLADFSLAPGCVRGHGSVYDALSNGEVDFEAAWALVTSLLGGASAPAGFDGLGPVFAVDVSAWRRRDAQCSPARTWYAGGGGRAVPAWCYSWVVALCPGACSWVLPLEARRVGGPGADPNRVAAEQIKAVCARLAGHGLLGAGRRAPVFVLDAGYSGPVLADLLGDVPVHLLVRLRARAHFYARPPAHTGRGRPRKHGPLLDLADPGRHAPPATHDAWWHERYGAIELSSWPAMHQNQHRGWDGYWRRAYPPGSDLPRIEGDLVHARPERLPRRTGAEQGLWLWHHGPSPLSARTCWALYARRFDIEHYFRYIKRHLGWQRVRPRTPAQADRYTLLVATAYAQLHLARAAASDLRDPWQKPLPPEQLTPRRVHRGFHRLHPHLPPVAQAPKTNRPGPGRPPGSTTGPAPRHPMPPTSKLNAKTRKGNNPKTKQKP